MKKIFILSFLILSFVSKAQISITNITTPYTQDFNTLATSGTSSLLPNSWFFLEGGSNANTTYAADNGSLNGGNTFSYGTGVNTDRALGSLRSSSLNSVLGVQFQNNTSTTITELVISYNGEQWRLGAQNRLDRLDFQYSTNATALNNGTWIDENALDFSTPNQTATIGALDGNSASNRTFIGSITIPSLSITPGTTFWLRWQDFDPSGADDGLSIDDFTINFTQIILPTCTEPTTQPTNLTLTPTQTAVTGNFDAAVPAVDGYLVVRSLSSTLSSFPVDAQIYSAGQALGGGTVVASDFSSSFTDVGLTPNTNYYYFVFAYNSETCNGGPNYLTTVNPAPTGNTNTTTTLPLAACVQPSAAPSSLTLSASNASISGTFTPEATANRYLVVISLSNTLSATPADGTTYTSGTAFGTGTVLYYGASNTFNAIGLSSNTLYYIYVFAANGDCTGEPDYLNTTSLDGNATTLNGTGVPPTYYNGTTGLTCQPLKTALKNIISTGTQVLSYTPGLWNLYPYSDKRRNDANTADVVWDMYSDNPTGADPYTFTFVTDQCGTYSIEGDCYNREHSTPQSWFSSASPMVSDAHHIFPTDGKVNGMRNNYPYGEVTSATFTSLNGGKLGTGINNFGYTSTVFEPINEYKGDFARAALYMAVRYEDQIISQNWSNKGNGDDVFLSTADEPIAATRQLQIYDDWFIKLLYKWHTQDPVSQKEIDRNNVIYAQLITDGASTKKQGNRNPFIDHPEFVAAIWGSSCLSVLPVTIIDFTAQKNNNAALLNWKVATETGIMKYEVERSTDGIVFVKIGEVVSKGLANYTFNDNNLPDGKTIYYRLKILGADGKYKNSSLATVKGNISNASINVFPNPANEKITIKLDKAMEANGLIVIYDIAGKALIFQNITALQTSISIATNHLASGRYFIKISDNKEVINSSFLIAK